MNFYKKLSMKSKLMGIAIGGVFFCSTTLIFIVSSKSESSLRDKIIEKLQAVVAAKADELRTSFEGLKLDIKNLTDSKFIQDALVSYESTAYGTGLDLEADAEIGSNTYFQNIEKKYSDSFADYLSSLPFRSFALALNNGFVVSTSGDKFLLGKNLKSGSLKSSSVARCLEEASKDSFHFTGRVEFASNQGFFLCQTIVSKYDRDGYQKNTKMGVLVAELDWTFFAKIKAFRESLGETGYLVVTDKDQLITPPRSQPELSLNQLVSQGYKFEEINSGRQMADSKIDGTTVLFASKKIDLPGGFDWNVLSVVSASEALASVRELKLWSYSILGLGLLLVSLLSWWLISSLVTSIVKSNALVSENSTSIDSAIQAFRSISESLTQGTQRQSAAIEETSASMEEINAMVTKALDTSRSSSQKAVLCNEKAQEGEAKISELLESVNQVHSTTEQSFVEVEKASLGSLKEVIDAFSNIGAKTKIINDIAFQTKLLSFNASVEAARAGEHGKGFSVVAAEIGQLAGSVDRSSKEIDEFLATTKSRIDSMIESTKRTIEQAASSSQSIVSSAKSNAEDGLQYFKELSELIQRIRDESSEVSTAADEQAKGVKEINKAIVDISHSNSNAVSMVSSLESQMEGLVESSRSLALAADTLSSTVFGAKSLNDANPVHGDVNGNSDGNAQGEGPGPSSMQRSAA